MAVPTIVTATLPAHYAHARRLFEDYQRWLGIDLSFQSFSEELDQISTIYGPPSGTLLLIKSDDRYVGCVGLRLLEGNLAEMKRMYLEEAFRGRGVGRALTKECISAARGLGYSAIRLDTIPRLNIALTIYRDLGFVEITPYRYNPDPSAIFLELKL
jgi:GNAT superfamily N-acetyltransferase